MKTIVNKITDVLALILALMVVTSALAGSALLVGFLLKGAIAVWGGIL